MLMEAPEMDGDGGTASPDGRAGRLPIAGRGQRWRPPPWTKGESTKRMEWTYAPTVLPGVVAAPVEKSLLVKSPPEALGMESPPRRLVWADRRPIQRKIRWSQGSHRSD